MLTAKFTVPRAQSTDIPRKRLLTRLQTAATPVTLICAPAGWGKSRLAGQLADDRKRAGDAVVWLTADGYDDATVLWGSLFTATRVALPALTEALAEPMFARRGNRGGAAAELLLDALDTLGRPVTVVIDDLGQITDRTAFAGLTRMIALAPPAVRVVLVTRRDPALPIARWRMDGMLTELRAADLATTVEEAGEMLRSLGTHLPPDDLDLLVQRTEGWIGGIRLAGLLLRQATDRAAAIRSLTGGQGGGSLARYLIEQVVTELDPADRAFLRDISALTTVPVELAAALTGRSDALAVLRRLVALTGFVAPLDDAEHSFRCHQLLTAALRYDLEGTDPERLNSLLRNASRWYADHDRPVDAVRYALHAKDWTLARELLDTHSARLTVGGRAATLRQMLAAFPRSSVLADPELAGIELSARLWIGDLRDHDELVRAIRAGLPELQQRDPGRAAVVTGKLAMADAMLARVNGDYEGLLAHMTSAADSLQVQPDASARQYRRQVQLSNQGTAEFWLGRFEPATGLFTTAIGEAGEPSLPVLNCQSMLSWADLVDGRLAAARQQADRATRLADDHRWTRAYQATPAYVARAIVAVECLDLPAAAGDLDRAETSWSPIGELAMGLTMAWCRARIATARGRYDEAVAILRTIRADARTRPTTTFLGRLLTWAEAETHAARGDWSRVAAIAPDLGRAPAALFAGRRAIGERAPLVAVRILADPDSRPGLGREFGVELRRELWLARAYQLTGQHARALGSLRAALDTAQVEGYRLPFAELGRHARPLLRIMLTAERGPRSDLVTTILAALPAVPSPSIPTQPVPAFTPREHDLITVLPTRMSNEAIADLLQVSTNTVKTHLRAVYRKLGVEDRDAAVEQAGRLGLL